MSHPVQNGNCNNNRSNGHAGFVQEQDLLQQHHKVCASWYWLYKSLVVPILLFGGEKLRFYFTFFLIQTFEIKCLKKLFQNFPAWNKTGRHARCDYLPGGLQKTQVQACFGHVIWYTTNREVGRRKTGRWLWSGLTATCRHPYSRKASVANLVSSCLTPPFSPL